MADPRGRSGATAPTQTAVGPPYNGAPLMKLRHFLVVIEVETKAKILSQQTRKYLTKQCFTFR